MNLQDVVNKRKTTNGFFKDEPVSIEHQHLLMKAASRAPSHLNSQPWRFILIDDKEKISDLATIAGRSMKKSMEGDFFTDNRKYFRFSQKECEEKGDGMLFSDMPEILQPLVNMVFESNVFNNIQKYGVSKILGNENKKLVETSPLLMAVLMEPLEHQSDKGAMDSYYNFAHGVTMGMALENIWLTCTDLNIGIQFVSAPQYYQDEWDSIKGMLKVPKDLKLMALMRLGYMPEKDKKAAINWKSSFRKDIDQFVYRNSYENPEKK